MKNFLYSCISISFWKNEFLLNAVIYYKTALYRLKMVLIFFQQTPTCLRNSLVPTTPDSRKMNPYQSQSVSSLLVGFQKYQDLKMFVRQLCSFVWHDQPCWAEQPGNGALSFTNTVANVPKFVIGCVGYEYEGYCAILLATRPCILESNEVKVPIIR